ncbi:MAG: glutamate---cysteine ligase / carboxylate-amine ligase [Solirubrobacteraceae bacterium]|jgi:carboxylate-amine ligase|nr:glutamate---cysteine ligase / carboxylate-amine ligase [Solirubrobacteraceae bacterium]
MLACPPQSLVYGVFDRRRSQLGARGTANQAPRRVTARRMDDEQQHDFGEGDPYSLGLEEELFVVDPESGRLLNVGSEVLERLGELERGEVKSELHRSQIELITGVCTTVDEAIGELCELRRAVLDTGVGLIASGTHPTAVEGDSVVTDAPRYERIRDWLGDAGATPVCALHIHVGMPDAPTAIRVFNGLRRYLPLLEALGANSPFRHGRDTGLASARELTLRSWPRAGVPRAMTDFDDFTRCSTQLTRVAEVPDYTYHWWKLRPHPRLGTVEIRALDTQVSPQHSAALVAAVHALARHEAQADPVEGPPVEILDEASFRAARAGIEATLPDHELRLRPVAELLEETVALVRQAARELRCETQLDDLARLLADGGGAGVQRAACGSGDTAALLQALVARAHDRTEL